MRLSNISFNFFKFLFVINTFLSILLVVFYAILNLPFLPKLLGLKDFFLVLVFLFAIIVILRRGKIVTDKISIKIYISILIYLFILSIYSFLYFSLSAIIGVWDPLNFSDNVDLIRVDNLFCNNNGQGCGKRYCKIRVFMKLITLLMVYNKICKYFIW
jgi:hypothetical protein